MEPYTGRCAGSSGSPRDITRLVDVNHDSPDRVGRTVRGGLATASGICLNRAWKVAMQTVIGPLGGCSCEWFRLQIEPSLRNPIKRLSRNRHDGVAMPCAWHFFWEWESRVIDPSSSVRMCQAFHVVLISSMPSAEIGDILMTCASNAAPADGKRSSAGQRLPMVCGDVGTTLCE